MSFRSPLSSSYLFVVLISTLVLAQSDRAPLGNRPNGLSTAQGPHQGPLNPRMPQRAPFAQRGTRASKSSAPLSNSSQASGLNFAPAVDYDSDGINSSVAVADLNGDGKPDLVVANYCYRYTNNSCTTPGEVGVLLGNGDGTFQPVIIYNSGGLNAYSIAVADVNGDGKLDVVVTNASTDSVGVLLGNGDGTLQTAVVYRAGEATGIAVADVNGDGKPDLVVADLAGEVGGYVDILLGNGDGTFQTAVPYDSGGWGPGSVAVADVNGDGKLDVAVANCAAVNFYCYDAGDGVVSILLGNGDGTFQTAVPYDSGGFQTSSIAVADVNGDDKPDLVAANCGSHNNSNCENGTVGVLLGNGDGTFQPAVTYGSGGTDSSPVGLAVADVNGDGKLDVVVTNYYSNVGVLLGNGDGTFQTVTFGSTGGDPVSVAVADVNGDGKPDLMLANSHGEANGDGAVGVLINTSTNATTTTLTSSPNPSNFGQTVTFTATVTGQPGFYKGTPTGIVSFYDGTTNIGNSNLNTSGVVTLTTSALPVGTDNITATYNGDSDFASSTSPAVSQVVQGAIVSLSPTSLNYGNQTVTINSGPQNVTLQNTGNINLSIMSIQITGTNSGDFAQTNNCPASLSPSYSCQISVTFTPTASGVRNAAVSITDNAPYSPQSVLITGDGVLPAVTLSPISLNFSNQGTGTTSSAEVITLSNTGAGILKITSISITGTNAGDFAQTNNCSSSIAPNGSCQISVTFAPKVTGTRNAAVSIADNAPGSPHSAPITGVGMPPGPTFSPTSLSFPTQVVYTTSKVSTVKLTNSGLGVLKITNIAVSGPFTQTHTCGSTVNPGASCTISVSFKPTTIGMLTGSLSITDNAPGSPQKVSLTGTGTYIQLTPTTVNFGNQPVGTKSLAKTITVANKGDVSVSITGFSITGTNASDFAQTHTCKSTLAAGASCFINTTFKPSATGTRTAQVAVTDSGGGSPQKVTLTGTGTP